VGQVRRKKKGEVTTYLDKGEEKEEEEEALIRIFLAVLQLPRRWDRPSCLPSVRGRGCQSAACHRAH